RHDVSVNRIGSRRGCPHCSQMFKSLSQVANRSNALSLLHAFCRFPTATRRSWRNRMFRKMILFALSGIVLASTVLIASTGPSTTQAPYLSSLQPGVDFVSIISAGDSVKKRNTTNQTYRMVGIPDGLGA